MNDLGNWPIRKKVLKVDLDNELLFVSCVNETEICKILKFGKSIQHKKI